MLTVNSSNEYQVALDMYRESVRMLDSVISEMFNFFDNLGYAVVIYYEDDYSKVVFRELEDRQIKESDLEDFIKRFNLKFLETTYTHTKDTLVGKYKELCYYHFKPKVVK